MKFGTNDITPGDGLGASWRQINEARDGARYLDRRRVPMRNVLAATRRRPSNASNGMFPFKVYLSQLGFDDGTMRETYDPSTWWQTFTVRAGRVWDKVLYGGGSDGYDTDPYNDYFSNIDDQGHPVSPIVVPAADPYYLWIEVLKDGTPKLRQGADPTNDSAGPSPSVNQWTKFPQMDGYHFEIAEIDTTAPPVAVIRQIANCDFIYRFREVTDCVTIAGVQTQVYRMAVVSDYYTTPLGFT